MESLPLDKNTQRMIHVLVANERCKEYKLGRGHNSSVRINDISVSRLHATIRYEDDGFYINDNDSKFGTIVLVQDKLYLQKNWTKAI